jgi:hypothetical protein
MKKWTTILYLLACLSLLLPPTAEAQDEKIQFGNLRIIPSLELQGVYDDNIYLATGTNSETELKESDFITHLLPELNLNYELPERGALSFAYEGDLAYYSGNSGNNWQTHKTTLGLHYLAPVGLVGDISFGYTDAEDPYGNIENYKLGLKTERTHTDLSASIGYDFANIFKIALFYSRYIQNYALARDYTQDYDADQWGLGFQRRMLPKTWGFFRYQYGGRDYVTHPAGTGVTEANDSDFNWHTIYVGLTWDIGAKLNGELNLGYQWKAYQNEIDRDGNIYDDKNTWVSSTQVSFQATPTTAFALGITKALRQSGSETSEYFEDTGVGINVQKLISTKFILTAGMVYSINSYNMPLDNPRDDNNFKLTAGLDYKIMNWLTAGLGYEYQKKDSNYEEYSYTDNRFTISLSAWY